MTKIIFTIFFYALAALAGFGFYVAGMNLFFSAGKDILFYRGLEIIIVSMAMVLLCLLMIARMKFKFIKNKPQRTASLQFAQELKSQVVAITLISGLLNLWFHSLILVNLDRSISVFLLGYMNNVNKPVSEIDLQTAFDNYYVKNYKAIGRRIDEQLASGMITIGNDNKISLTNKAQNFLVLSTWITNVFHSDSKFVNPILK